MERALSFYGYMGHDVEVRVSARRTPLHSRSPQEEGEGAEVITPHTKMPNVMLTTEDKGSVFVITIRRDDGRDLTLREIAAALTLMSQRLVEKLKNKLS